MSLSEVIGKLNGTVSEQMKALDRFKFIAIEAETLHGATKEQLSKALLELEEGLFVGSFLCLESFHETGMS